MKANLTKKDLRIIDSMDLLRLNKEIAEEISKRAVETGQTRTISKAVVFVDHIKKHLKENQVVVCKICDKTIDEIFKDAKI